MARRTKLNDTVQGAICDALSIGVPRGTAAVAGGVSERTFYNWIERGEAATRGKFVQFVQAVAAAENQAELTAMAVWRTGMATDWRAAKEFLERRFPQKYALAKDRSEAGDQGPREVYVVREDQLSEEEWDEITGRTTRGTEAPDKARAGNGRDDEHRAAGAPRRPPGNGAGQGD